MRDLCPRWRENQYLLDVKMSIAVGFHLFCKSIHLQQRELTLVVVARTSGVVCSIQDLLQSFVGRSVHLLPAEDWLRQTLELYLMPVVVWGCEEEILLAEMLRQIVATNRLVRLPDHSGLDFEEVTLSAEELQARVDY